MKLPIKKKYFDEILYGKKHIEYRDAHITFICEDTGRTTVRDVIACKIVHGMNKKYPDVLEDNFSIAFHLGKEI